MTLEEARTKVGKGWWPLLEKFWNMVAVLSAQSPVEVTEVGHRIGMLCLKAKADDPLVQEMLDKIAWTFERDSTPLCEECGERGYRRKELPGSPNRCRPHFIELANEMADRGEI